MPISSVAAVQTDPARVAALRAILRDNTGRVSSAAKAQAFNSLPFEANRLDIRV